MCGILGVISNDHNYNFDEMLSKIAHRGPDDNGTFIHENIKLGHQRLSIQDLSSNGHQPMFSDDNRFVIIFNGEIYNHLELRNKLSTKYLFKSNSDTETILYGFIEHGIDLFNMLNGIFAFSIFDTETGELIIARDHFGVKPLYYISNRSLFAFSSELKTIINFSENSEFNLKSLFNYLYFLWSPGEDTPIMGFKKLLPGHYIKLNIHSLESININKYYDIPFNNERLNITENQLIEELDQKLIKSVQRQLLSDVPVGFFLSGGLDSSLIVAIAKKLRPNIQTTCFTIDSLSNNSSDGFVDDLFYARKVAKYLDVKLEEIKAEVNILKDFDKMIWHLDEPQADPAPINVLNICTRARELGFKVLLGGSAGDDLFSGYRRHQQLYFNKLLKFFPIYFFQTFYKITCFFPIRNHHIRRIRKFFSYFAPINKNQRLVSQFGWLDKKRVLELFSEKSKIILDKYDPSILLIESLNNISFKEADLNKILYLEMKYFLVDHNLNYTDKMSMATGVEVRVPYLDIELVDFTTKIPPHLKMKGLTTKYILRKVAEKYLPKDIIYRPKSGFGAPVRDWIINDLDSMIFDYLSPINIDKREIFDSKAVWKLIEDNRSGKVDASYTIWALLSIESWLRQFRKEVL
jgi:asparagine synthase (glutamine-hydrolysing)